MTHYDASILFFFEKGLIFWFLIYIHSLIGYYPLFFKNSLRLLRKRSRLNTSLKLRVYFSICGAIPALFLPSFFYFFTWVNKKKSVPERTPPHLQSNYIGYLFKQSLGLKKRNKKIIVGHLYNSNNYMQKKKRIHNRVTSKQIN